MPGETVDMSHDDEAIVIGDLHGDLTCARHWVRRSGLVDLDSKPWKWTGGEDTKLIFMGDYVDKGPQGRQVLELVRDLTRAFPRNVIAMLGNHDVYLLWDTLFEDGATSLMGRPVRDFAYAFTHPEEYFNWIPDGDLQAEDHRALQALFEALEWVYNHRAQGQVALGSSRQLQDIFNTAPVFVNDQALASLARDRLSKWRRYMAAGMLESGLAQWLSERPVITRVGSALFVHAGLAVADISSLDKHRDRSVSLPTFLSRSLSGIPLLLRGVKEPGSLRGDPQSLVPQGRLNLALLDQAITNRDLHGGCRDVQRLLGLFNSSKDRIETIAVAHTPGDTVRETCGGRLLAMDSSLSRYFRAFGNLYCPTGAFVETATQGVCAKPVPEACMGQASRLRNLHGKAKLVRLEAAASITKTTTTTLFTSAQTEHGLLFSGATIVIVLLSSLFALMLVRRRLQNSRTPLKFD